MTPHRNERAVLSGLILDVVRCIISLQLIEALGDECIVALLRELTMGNPR